MFGHMPTLLEIFGTVLQFGYGRLPLGVTLATISLEDRNGVEG
jgi:hypothetical protein